MKEKFNRFLKRVKLFIREIGNLLANVLVPLVSLLILIVDLFPVPTAIIAWMKKIEYWLFFASGTADKIDKILEENIKEDIIKLEKKQEAKAKDKDKIYTKVE